MQITKILSILFVATILLSSCSDDDDTISKNTAQAPNKKPLGSSANDLLSAREYRSLNIEMVSVQGFEPTPIAVANLKSFLEDRLFKPDGITINQRSISSSRLAPFTTEEILELENKTRTSFDAGDEITVYIYFADGSNEGDSDTHVTLGTAYRNTSLVIYEGTIRRLGSRINSPSVSTIETATLHHEFAHLLGLVDIGTPQQSQHEDTTSKGHCNVKGCLMEATIGFGNGMMEMLGNGIPELDAQCIADLRANGGR